MPKICKKGHEIVGDNLFIGNRGNHQCRICLNEYQRLYRKANPEKYRQRAAKYTAKSKDKTRVQAHARYHTAELKKDACEWCGSIINLQMHHHDYDKPLEVTTLCIKCHNKEHIRLRKEYHGE